MENNSNRSGSEPVLPQSEPSAPRAGGASGGEPFFRKKSIRNGCFRVLAAVFWIGVWQIAATCVGTELYLPSPVSVLRSLAALVPTAAFWKTVGGSMLRVAKGYGIGCGIGIVLGIATAKIRFLDLLFAPILSVVRTTPVSSFILLTLVFLGRNAVPSFVVVLMVVPIVWASTAQGVRSVDQGLWEVCRAARLTLFRRLRILWIPHCLPFCESGVLTALGFAWKAGIAAEVLCTPKGSVGKMMYDAKVYLETADLFAWTAVVVVLSMILEAVLKALLKRRQAK